MCNACGNLCCGSDQFDSCGCDHCPESDCWDIAEGDPDDDIGDFDFEFPRCCPVQASRPLICEEVPSPCAN